MKVRVFQLARELKISSDALVHIITELGEDGKSHMSAVEDDLVVRIRAKIAETREKVKSETARKHSLHPETARTPAEAKPIASVPPSSPPVLPPVMKTPTGAVPPAGPPARPAAPSPTGTSHPAPAPGSRPPSAPEPKGPRSGAPGPYPYSTGGRPGGSGAPSPGGSGGRPPLGPQGAGRPAPRPSTTYPPAPYRTSTPPNRGSAPRGPSGPSGMSGGGSIGGGVSSPPGGSRPGGPPSGAPRTLGLGGGLGSRDRRRKKAKGTTVDEAAVRENVRRVIAGMDGNRPRSRRRRRADEGEVAEESRTLKVHEFLTVAELASTMEVKPTEVIQVCLSLGILANINRRLDKDAITAILLEFDFEPEFETEFGVEAELVEETDQEYDTRHRAPIVTVMGHVDHGKTSLLDYIRKAKVIETESGGITQHIGAYLVHQPQGNIAFLDTPGHEAFTAMRARGAQITDIVVLVVAADDRVRPQTIEAINHAKAANVPIIVAINKIDLPNANVDRIKKELADASVLVEDWGGTTVAVEISAKQGTNVDKLLEMILIVAELANLEAQPERPAKGTVIESRRDSGRGVVATVLVQNGTLRVGDAFFCGSQFGRVRAMNDERGQRVNEALPSTPVEVLGWSGVPAAGDGLVVMRDEGKAREIALHRSQIQREHEHRLSSQIISLQSIQERIKKGELKELNIVLKADVGGSLEVLRDHLGKITHGEVRVRIIHEGVGLINESDVLLAKASGAIIVGFHTRPDSRAHQLALTEKVDVRLYRVIYEVEKEIKDAMSGLLAPEKIEKISGSAEVRRIFRVAKVGTIAGCFVVSGSIKRNDRARVYRGVDVVHDGKFASIKRIKDDVREVQSGFECGIGLEGFEDLKEGDVIESYAVEEVARKIE